MPRPRPPVRRPIKVSVKAKGKLPAGRTSTIPARVKVTIPRGTTTPQKSKAKPTGKRPVQQRNMVGSSAKKTAAKPAQKTKPRGVSPERIKLSGRPLEIETGRRINVTRNDTLRFRQGKTKVVGLKKKI